MVRIVAGKSCSGKSGYIMARFQINVTPVRSVANSGTIPDGAIIHFPFMQQLSLATGGSVSPDELLMRIKHQYPETQVDFLYCGYGELCSRQRTRKHTEANLTGYVPTSADGRQDKSAYEKQLLHWLDRFRSFGWNANLIHSHGGKYYVRNEEHFRRIISSEESLVDRLMYFTGIHKPVAVRGWGPYPLAAL